jgi:hypothetical protein
MPNSRARILTSQSGDAVHLLVCELEVEDVEVGAEVLLTVAFGMAATFSCWTSQRSATWAAVLPWALPTSRSVASRSTPPRESGGSDQEVVQRAGLVQQGVLAPVDVVLDLVAEDLRVPRGLFDQRRGEVADADVPDGALLLKLPHRAQGLPERHPVAGPVHEEQVYVSVRSFFRLSRVLEMTLSRA